MKSVRAGDVYFLTDSNSVVADVSKDRVEILSARPVVVIRPPVWWDPNSTVTVVPTMNSGPVITLTLEDRQGRTAKSDYPFAPQTPYSIPVKRLGKYIGSLDPDELEEILYAFKWIHDPFMQLDRDCKVPGVFHDVVASRTPKGSSDETRAVYQLVKEIPAAVPITAQNATNITAISATPAPEPEEPKQFPSSIFDYETLTRVAGRFRIDAEFLDGTKKARSPYLLKFYELSKLQGELTNGEFEAVLAYYSMMSPFDAQVIGPRVPAGTLQDITKLTKPQTLALKALCNYMRDMLQSDYETREAENRRPVSRVEECIPEIAKTTGLSEEQYDEMLKKVKPFLTAKGISRMPTDAAKVFMKLPKWRVKRAYSGPQFEVRYTEAVRLYQGINKEKESA